MHTGQRPSCSGSNGIQLPCSNRPILGARFQPHHCDSHQQRQYHLQRQQPQHRTRCQPCPSARVSHLATSPLLPSPAAPPSSSSSTTSSAAAAAATAAAKGHHRRSPLRPPPCPPVPAAAGQGPAGSDALAGLFMAYAAQMQQQLEQQQAAAALPGANVLARGVSFHPPGVEAPLLNGVSFDLRSNQLGLVIGRSGSGKTTLLQLLAGLTEQTAGDLYISRDPLGPLTDASGNGTGSGPVAAAPGLALPPPTHIEQRMQQVGLVFQFPERHFLGGDLMEELTFAWPRDFKYWGQRQALAVRLQQVMDSVGLSDVPLNIPPSALSGGQQRRLALAIQLVRQPSLLLLDEPLSGLDWRARAEVVELLRAVKRHCTLLVVSHDLREIAELVDVAWRMRMGGRMEAVAWPPGSLTDLEEEGKETGDEGRLWGSDAYY